MSDHELLGLIEAELVGDADTTRMATGALSEALKMAGGAGADYQQKKADAKKSKDVEAAQAARTTAQIAALQAQTEKDPGGPLHIAAFKAEAEAQRLEAKAGVATGSTSLSLSSTSSSAGGFFTKMHGPLPTWGWFGVGAIGVGAIWGVVKLLGGKKRR